MTGRASSRPVDSRAALAFCRPHNVQVCAPEGGKSRLATAAFKASRSEDSGCSTFARSICVAPSFFPTKVTMPSLGPVLPRVVDGNNHIVRSRALGIHSWFGYACAILADNVRRHGHSAQESEDEPAANPPRSPSPRMLGCGRRRAQSHTTIVYVLPARRAAVLRDTGKSGR